MDKKKVIIIGGGTAGLTIARYLQNYFDVMLIERSRYKKYPIILSGINSLRLKNNPVNITTMDVKNILLKRI